MKLYLSSRNRKVVGYAIGEWKKAYEISLELARKLESTLVTRRFDWKRLATYSLWCAFACFAISLVTFFTSDLMHKLMDIFVRHFRWLIDLINQTPAWVKSLNTAVLATFAYFWAFIRGKRYPGEIRINAMAITIGVIATAISLYFFALAINAGKGNLPGIFLMGSVVYGAIAIIFASRNIWILALCLAGCWFLNQTWGNIWWEEYSVIYLNVRFALLGCALAVAGIFPVFRGRLGNLRNTTHALGLFYLFIALWILSVSGDVSDPKKTEASQMELLIWSLILAVAAIAVIYHGLKYENGISRGFGLTFLLINIYTRFFEYFWDSIHKAIFFAILGVSFWWLYGWSAKTWALIERHIPAHRNK